MNEIERRDVVIFNYETNIVDTIAGREMRYNAREGYLGPTAEKRQMTVLSQCNHDYGAAIVPCGKYEVGDSLLDEDIE